MKTEKEKPAGPESAAGFPTHALAGIYSAPSKLYQIGALGKIIPV
jgi:hypothetical protein